MKQFGKKTLKAKPETASDIAIRLSKDLICELACEDFFSGKESNLTPGLKGILDAKFRKLVAKNSKIQPTVWTLLIEHVTDFTDEAFRLKRTKGSFYWTDANEMLFSFSWSSAK